MASVICTPLLAQTDLVMPGVLFLVGLGIGVVVMYFVGLSARSRFESASQQLANLQGQNLKQRATTIGIPQGDVRNEPLPPKKSGLPPKKEKPREPADGSEERQQLQAQIESLTDQNATLLLQVEAEQQQRAAELQRTADLEQSLASQNQPSSNPSATSTDQQWQLDQLHRENIELQTTIDQYQDQIDKLQANVGDPQAAGGNPALEAENVELRQQVQQLEEVQTQADRLAEKLYASEELLRDAQLHVEQSDQAAAHLQAQISEYEANIEKLESQTASKGEEGSDANASLDELRSILAQSEAAVASLEREKLDYKNQLEELRGRQNADAALLLETAESTKEENEANKQLIEQLKQELGKRDEQLLAVQKGMNDLYTARDRVVALEIANAERNATVERLESELQQARAAAKQAASDAQASLSEPQADPDELAALKEETESKGNELAAAKKEIDELKLALSETQESLAAAQAADLQAEAAELEELKEALAQAHDELASQKEHAANDETRFEQLKQELLARDEQAQQSNENLEKLRSENDRLASELDAERNHVPPETIQEIDLLRSELTRHEEEKTASALRFAELTQSITQLTNELDNERTNTPPPVAHQVGVLQRQLEQQNAFAEQANHELNELRSALHQLQSEKDEIEAERDSASAEIRKLQKKNSAADSLKSEFATIAEEREKLQQNAETLGESVRELEEKLRDATTERDAATRLANELREQIDVTPTAQAELVALQQQVMTLISDKEKERDLREEAQYRAEDLEAELSKLKEDPANSSPTNEELDNARLEIEQLKSTCLKYQGEAEEHAQKMLGQSSELAELRATAEVFESAKQELKGQIVGLSERMQQLELEIDARDERLAVLSAELETSREHSARLAEAERQLNDANTRRAQLQTATEQAQQQIEELQAISENSEDYDAANAKIAELQKRLKTERASLEQGIQQRDRQIQFLTSDRDEIKKNAKLTLDQKRLELDSLKEKTDELVAAIAEARTERQSMEGKLAAEHRAASQLKQQLDAAKVELESQVGANETVAEKLAESEQLQVKLTQAENDAEATRENLQAAIGKISELELALDEQVANQSGDSDLPDEKAVKATAERIEKLETQVEEYEEENTLLIAEMRQLREHAEGCEKQMLEARAEVERVALEAKEIAEAKGSGDADEPAADTKKGKLKRQVKELEAELASTKEELYKQSESANAWRKERSELLNQIEAFTGTAVEAESSEGDGEDITEEYLALVKEHDQLAKKLDQTGEAIAGKDDRIDELASALAAARRNISALKSELTESQAVIRSQLRGMQPETETATQPTENSKQPTKKSAARAMKSSLQDADNPSKKAKKPKAKKAKSDGKKQTKQKTPKKSPKAKATDDPKIGNVFLAAPAEQDDLRNIKGLGPAFQNKLNEIGIYQYSQIAKWTSKISDEIAERIGAGPRIKNDKWVQQAKRLAKKAGKR